MTKKLQVYKCGVCGNIVEVLHEGAGQLVCCNEPMMLMEENTTDAALEKHVPVVEKAEGGYRVRVGSAPHPMEEKHYIEWVQLLTDHGAYRRFLEAGGAPEAFFEVTAEKVEAREYCNLHGLWKGK